MWDKYEEFQEVLDRFQQNKMDHRANMQRLIPRTVEGAYRLMLMYAASRLNFTDSKRYAKVLLPNWEPDWKWEERLLAMGITETGEYTGDDHELLLLDKDVGHIRKPRKGTKGFLPLFKAWQKEVFYLGADIYPSGELTGIMEQMCQRAMKTGQFLVIPNSDTRPKRDSQEFRVKELNMIAAGAGDAAMAAMAKTQNARDLLLQKKIREEFDYAINFTVHGGKAIWQDGKSPPPDYFTLVARGIPYETATACLYLNKWLNEEQKRNNLTAEESHLNNQKLARHAAAECGAAKLKTNLESTNMSKTNQFVNTIKGIFGNVVRMQRGRAAVHATKRIIFKAFPIKWGILARITGKAKSVEDHPLTDVAVALLAHGAASALLDDPIKREKYLKYTEEMVAASVANAGFKMVPVEEILDKVLNGALDSEAVQKVKNVLADAK